MMKINDDDDQMRKMIMLGCISKAFASLTIVMIYNYLCNFLQNYFQNMNMMMMMIKLMMIIFITIDNQLFENSI